MAMTQHSAGRIGAATPPKLPPPTRKARRLDPLSYLDVRAVAETCVIELMRQGMLRESGEVPVGLATATAFEVFRRQARGEGPVAPSFAAGFGDVADNHELAERFAICLAELIDGKLLVYTGKRSPYEIQESGAVVFHGMFQLTSALINQIDLEEAAT